MALSAFYTCELCDKAILGTSADPVVHISAGRFHMKCMIERDQTLAERVRQKEMERLVRLADARDRRQRARALPLAASEDDE